MFQMPPGCRSISKQVTMRPQDRRELVAAMPAAPLPITAHVNIFTFFADFLFFYAFFPLLREEEKKKLNQLDILFVLHQKRKRSDFPKDGKHTEV